MKSMAQMLKDAFHQEGCRIQMAPAGGFDRYSRESDGSFCSGFLIPTQLTAWNSFTLADEARGAVHHQHEGDP